MTHLGKRLGRPFAVGLVALVSLTMVLVAPGSASARATTASSNQSPIVAKNDAGTLKSRVTGTVEGGRRLAGTFTPTSFEVVGDQLMANGVLDAVIRGHGKPMHATKNVSLPVKSIGGDGGRLLAAGGKGLAASAAAGSCDILNLVLGPLDLDLLGLQVHLDKVVLNIVAQSGAGNLLGNLLCAVAGLLDNGSPLSGLLGQVSDLLNQILGQLGLLQL